MKNWSTDSLAFMTNEARERWELEQLINYGLDGRKIRRSKLEEYFDKIDIDPARRHFLELLLRSDGNTYTDPKKIA